MDLRAPDPGSKNLMVGTIPVSWMNINSIYDLIFWLLMRLMPQLIRLCQLISLASLRRYTLVEYRTRKRSYPKQLESGSSGEQHAYEDTRNNQHGTCGFAIQTGRSGWSSNGIGVSLRSVGTAWGSLYAGSRWSSSRWLEDAEEIGWTDEYDGLEDRGSSDFRARSGVISDWWKHIPISTILTFIFSVACDAALPTTRTPRVTSWS